MCTNSTKGFVLKMDRFYDNFNVRDLNEGRKTRKAARDPYRSKEDWRLEVTPMHIHICMYAIYILYTVAKECVSSIPE